MKIIPLTKGKHVVLDDCDYEALVDVKWYALTTASGNIYAARSMGKGKGVVLMHRLIMGNPKGKFVDHIDRDTLNNRRSNLRICTTSQNTMNSAKGSMKCSSRFKGVSFDKWTLNKVNKWRSCIWKDGRFNHIGHFLTQEDAAKAYNKKAMELFGEFAYMNDL